MKKTSITRLVGIAVVSATLVSGCAVNPAGEAAGTAAADGEKRLQISCKGSMTPEHRVELDAIDALMASSRYYAALARLEALPFQTQEHWLRWAQLLARVDQLDYSQDVYLQIAETCDSARAWHGLGVVRIKVGKVREGLEALSRAKNMDPSSVAVRNDFGIALMRSGFPGQAAFELRTAYELSDGKESIGRSMVAAYYLQGGQDSVEKIQQELGLGDTLVDAGIVFSKHFAGGSR